MLQEAFRDNATGHSKTFLWYKRFKDGQTSVDDNDEHSETGPYQFDIEYYGGST